ncbi:uncharacterized protein FFM5_15372 [Fusarium fujikuroi]|nr:uncharacterized protein FFM5_15372 [Fusarium fujikuroi]
MASILLYIILT